MKTPTTKQWIRAAADRVSLGSTRLITHHVGRFLRTAKSRVSSWPWWVQLIAAGVALKCGVPVLTALGDWAHRKATASRSGLFIAAALWLLSAYRVGHPDWKPKTTEQGPDADPPQAEQPETAAEEPQPPFAPASISPTELVAAVRDVGTPNAQLVPLAEHLRVSTAAVRAAAAAVRWPVKDVRQDGRSSSAGLRWDDCPSPESTYPLSGVVGAGQSADDNDDDSEEGQTGSGVRVKAIGLAGHSLFRRHNVESAREHATD